MGWKKVAVAGFVAPALGGCNVFHLAAHNLANEPHVVHTQWAIDRELRADARAEWKEVRAQFPRRLFTAEFRDGFLDGYTDYLARGGTAQPPAVPPPKYTRDKKYFTPEGHCLLRDYFLGFKYGLDVAVASGQRKFLTVPVLLADKPDGPPSFTIQPEGDHKPVAGLPAPPAATPPQPLGPPRPLPVPPGTSVEPAKQPDNPPKAEPPKIDPPKIDPRKVDPPKPPGTGQKPGVPWASPASLPVTRYTAPAEALPKPKPVPADTGSKFGSGPPPIDAGAKADPETRLPVPNPPLPIPAYPVDPPKPRPRPESADPIRPTPPPRPKTDDPPAGVRPVGLTVKLPDPPAEVPTLPNHLPTPSVLDDLPVVPANHAVPDPLPANHVVPAPVAQP